LQNARIIKKQTKQKQIKSKTKKNTINEKRGKKTTKQLKSMQIQINKQKCILKLFLFDLFDMHLMNILKQTLVYL
jgi:hypothetical protein